VVLEAGSAFGGDSWTRFCLQQADRILAVGSGGAVPAGADGRRLGGCDLVAWDVAQGSGALAGWTAMLDPVETHALRPADLEAGMARLARRLRGRSVGVVLSGGGARAFAHIGVLEALVEAGVLIDRVAGVSRGALVGAMFATGMDPEEIDARCATRSGCGAARSATSRFPVTG
jgi:NTE family protein